MSTSNGLLHLRGRKRESSVWKYFVYSALDNSTRCLVEVSLDKIFNGCENGGEEWDTQSDKCGKILAGKNPTNLKTHLRTSHPRVYKEFEYFELQRKGSFLPPAANNECGEPLTYGSLQERLPDHIEVSKRSTWEETSREHMNRQNAVVSFFGKTLQSTSLADDPEFIKMIQVFEPRFNLPGSKKLNRLLKQEMFEMRCLLQQRLTDARKISIGLDIWSKKGLSASFLGISAFYYNQTLRNTEHVFLALHQIDHPHTSDTICTCLMKTLNRWSIPVEKILFAVSDDGSNMAKPVNSVNFKLNDIKEEIHDGASDEESNEDFTGDVNDSAFVYEDLSDGDALKTNNGDDFEAHEDNILQALQMTCMACLPYTLQLVINKVSMHKFSQNVIDKARQITKTLCKSSIATEMLTAKCGQAVITYCSTKWNSTLTMLKRLLETKSAIIDVLSSLRVDGLSPSEWLHIDELCKLLDPFVEHTNLMQAESATLSNIIPTILDLEVHLQTTGHCGQLTMSMLKSLKERFACILNPELVDFNPIPAAACLLDPSVANVMLTNGMESLLSAAKAYILIQVSQPPYTKEMMSQTVAGSPSLSPEERMEPPLKKFKYLTAHMNNNPQSLIPMPPSPEKLLSRYLLELETCQPTHSLDFWINNEHKYLKLAELAQDLMSAPASQAHGDQIFSLCDQLTIECTNRMSFPLETRVFLKLNSHFSKT